MFPTKTEKIKRLMPGSSHVAEFQQESSITTARESLGIDAEPVQACQVLLQVAKDDQTFMEYKIESIM